MGYRDSILKGYGLGATHAASHLPVQSEEDHLLASLGGASMSALQYIGGSLDKPGSAVRGLLAGRPDELLNLIPFSDTLGITSMDDRVSGRDLLRMGGMIGKKDNWSNFAGGLALEIATDPLTFLGPMTSASKTLAGKAAAKAGHLPTTAAGRIGGSINSVMDDLAKHGEKFGDLNPLNAFKQNIAHTVEKMGLDSAGEAAFRAEPLSGIMSFGVPGVPSMQKVFGAGAKEGSLAMKTAEGVDALSKGLRESRVGTLASEMFDNSVLGRKMASSQAAVRATSPLMEETMSGFQSAHQEVFDVLQKQGIDDEVAIGMLERVGPAGDVTTLGKRIEGMEGDFVRQADLFTDLWGLNAAQKADVAPGLAKMFGMYDEMHKLQVNAGIEPSFYFGKYGAYSPLRSKLLDNTENVTRHIGQNDELQRAVQASRHEVLDMPGGLYGIERAMQDDALRALNDAAPKTPLRELADEDTLDALVTYANINGIDSTPLTTMGRWVDRGQKGPLFEQGSYNASGKFVAEEGIKAEPLSLAQVKSAKEAIRKGEQLSTDTLPIHRKTIDAPQDAIDLAHDKYLSESIEAGAAARAVEGEFLDEAKRLLGPAVGDAADAVSGLADDAAGLGLVDDVPSLDDLASTFYERYPHARDKAATDAAAKAAREAAPTKEAGKAAAKQVREEAKAARAAHKEAVKGAKATEKAVRDAAKQQAKDAKLAEKVGDLDADGAIRMIREAMEGDGLPGAAALASDAPAWQIARAARDALKEHEAWIDNPRGDWLEGHIERAIKAKAEDGSIIGSTTAGVKDVPMSVDDLLGVKGLNAEHTRMGSPLSQKKIQDLADSIAKDGLENPPLIVVDVDGIPWVSEGNHRIRAAKAAGLTDIPVEVRWHAGAEESVRGWSLDDIAQKVSPGGGGGLPPSLAKFGGSIDEIDAVIRTTRANMEHAKGIATMNGSIPAKHAAKAEPFFNHEFRTIANAKIAHSAYMTRNARATTMAFAKDAGLAGEQLPGHMPLAQAMKDAGITGMNANKRIAEDLLAAGKISEEVHHRIINSIAEDGVNVLDDFTVPIRTKDDFKLLGDTGKTASALFPIINATDIATNVAKAHFTITRPAFHGRNALTLAWQDFLAGGHKNITGMYRAAKNKNTLFTDGGVIPGSGKWAVFHGMKLTDEAATNIIRNRHVIDEISPPHSGGIVEKVGQAADDVADTFQSQVPGTARQSSAMDVLRALKPELDRSQSLLGQAKQLAQQANPLAMRGGMGDADKFIPVKAGAAAADFGETTGRTMTWLRKLEEGSGWAPAKLETNAAHVDYKSLTRVEREYLKRWMPWYTFNRKMIPYQLSELARNPGGIVAQTIRSSSQSSDFTPEQVVGSIPVGEEVDGMQKYLTPDLPHESINALFKVEPTALGTVQQTLMGHAAQLHPVPKFLGETMSGQSFHRGGQDLTSMRGPLTPLNPSNEDVRLGGTLASNAISNSPLAPYLSQLKSIRDTRKSVPERLMNLLTGLRTHDVDVSAAKARAQSDAIRDQLTERGWREFSRLYKPGDAEMTDKEANLDALLKGIAKERRKP